MVSRWTIAVLLGGLWIASLSIGIAYSANSDQSQTAGGVTVYLGVVPAAIVEGVAASGNAEQLMHGGIPKGDPMNITWLRPSSLSQAALVSDAIVTAEVSDLGLSGNKRKLEKAASG